MPGDDALQRLLAEEPALWEQLRAALDGAGERVLHGASDDAWTAAEAWAHLARWMRHAEAYVTAVRDGREPVSITDADAANARWRAEDAAVSLHEARERAVEARAALLALAESLPDPAVMDRAVEVIAVNTTEHYCEHLDYIARGPEAVGAAFPSGNDRWTFCPKCGARFGREVRAGRERLVCPECRFVFWQNPNAGVAAVLIEDGAVLLTRRGGSERGGLWDLPGGFVEYDEDIRSALVREIREETGLEIEVGRVFEVHSNFFRETQRHSVGVWFLVRRVGGTLGAADDVTDARFFPLDALPPAAEIAFETDRLVLARVRAQPPVFEQ